MLDSLHTTIHFIGTHALCPSQVRAVSAVFRLLFATAVKHNNCAAKVAIKSPRADRDADETAYAEARQVLLEETAILAQLRHSNVVRLVGVVTRGQQARVVMELCAMGSLSSLLMTMYRTHTMPTPPISALRMP